MAQARLLHALVKLAACFGIFHVNSAQSPTGECQFTDADGSCQADGDQASLMQLRQAKQKLAVDSKAMKASTETDFLPETLGSSNMQCAQDTGAKCRFGPCDKSRNATCVDNKCMCVGGDSCAWEGACHSLAQYQCHARTAGEMGAPRNLMPAGAHDNQPVGARFWVSQAVLDYLGDTIVGFLVRSLEAVTFPEIQGNKNGLSYHLSHIEVNAGTTAKASFVKDQGLKVLLHNVEVKIKLDFEASFGPFWTQGIVRAATDPDKTYIGATVDADVSPDGYPVVWLQEESVKAAFEHIKFSGSSISGVTNFVTWLFQDVLDGMLQNLLKSAVKEIFCGPVTRVLQTWDTVQELPFPAPYNVSAIDIGLHSIRIGDDHMELAVTGGILDISGTDLKYPVAPAPLPMPSGATDAFVTAAATQWIVNSMLWLYQEKGLLHYQINNQTFPKPSDGVLLTTGSLGWWVPGLWFSHGYDRSVLVDIYSEQAPKAILENNHVRMEIDIVIAFFVELPDSKKFAFSIGTGLECELAVDVGPDAKAVPLRSSVGPKDPKSGPTCKASTGDTCYFLQCDSWQQSVCRNNQCKCRSGFCFVGDRCVEQPTEPPAPEPTEPPPELQELSLHFTELEVKPFKVKDTKVGWINNLLLNWALDVLMPILENLVNQGFERNPFVINATQSPIQPTASSILMNNKSVKVFSDFWIAPESLYLGELLVGTLNSKVNEAIYSKLR